MKKRQKSSDEEKNDQMRSKQKSLLLPIPGAKGLISALSESTSPETAE